MGEYVPEPTLSITKLILYTVRNYSKAIRFGTKYIYQTVPRLLTVWLHCGEQPEVYALDVFNKMNEVVASLVRDAPACKVGSHSTPFLC